MLLKTAAVPGKSIMGARSCLPCNGFFLSPSCGAGSFIVKIIRTKDYADMSRKAANIISAQVIMKPDCVLGLATGGTPVGT